eukprot:3407976-Amphidinium_carterae.1
MFKALSAEFILMRLRRTRMMWSDCKTADTSKGDKKRKREIRMWTFHHPEKGLAIKLRLCAMIHMLHVQVGSVWSLLALPHVFLASQKLFIRVSS